MRLKNKVAIVTGGGTGIGKGTAIMLAKEGANIMIAGRRHETIEQTADIIKKFGGIADSISTDVSKDDQVTRMVERTIGKYGKIDILFNNAAIFSGVGKTIVEIDEYEWDNLMSVNLKGVFLCAKHVIPYMIENGGGAIINCSSVSGHIGQKNQGAYNAAKGGVEMLTKCIALDFAKYNIRTNCVCPAWVEIDFNKEEFAQHREEINQLHPMGRTGTPEDVGYAVVYLASDESSWVTGTSIMVDGGYTAQ